MDKAEALQDKINVLQQDMHCAVKGVFSRCKPDRNKISSSRRTVIKELMKAKALPENFWAMAIISLLRAEKENGTLSDFLGPYDEELLSQYLLDLLVEYGPKGYRVTCTFKPNPYFEETELWAECFDTAPPTVEDGAPVGEVPNPDEEEDIDESWMFSGITWKDGHGPQLSDDEDEDEDARPGSKRGRDDSSSNAAKNQGPSILQVFSLMPPHPDDEDLDEEMDEEEEAEAIQGWEDEMDDRTLLMRTVVNDIYTNPIGAIQRWESARKESDCSDAKRVKAE